MRHLPILLSGVLLASCAATKTAPIPDAAMATRSKANVATLQQGHAVYLAHCGRCHEHILPKDVSKEDWHVVAPGMAWNAGISAADEKALTAYLLAATK
jgi:hypothetical protein